MSLKGAVDFENNSVEDFTIVGTGASVVGGSVINGTYSFQCANSFFGSFIYYSPASNASMGQEMYMHCWWRTSSLLLNRTVLVLYDGVSTANPSAEVVLEGNKLVVYVYTGAARAGAESTTGSTVIVVNTNYRLEFQYIRSNGNTKGYVELKINGSSEATKEHSTSVGHDAQVFAAFGRTRHIAFGGSTHTYDDCWVNNSATSPNDSWPGNLTFVRARPDSDGNYDNWRGKPTDTNRYQMVDEVAVDDSDMAVDDNVTPSTKQSFGVAAISTGKTIRAIKTMIRCQAPGISGTATSSLVRQDSTDYLIDIDKTGTGIDGWGWQPFRTEAADQGPQYYDTLPDGNPLGAAGGNAAVSALEIGGSSDSGTSVVAQKVPTSDISQGWARSAGADNYALVDEGEIPADVDTSDYIQSANNGELDIYGMAAVSDLFMWLGTDPIKIYIHAQISAGAASSVEGYLRMGGTNYATDGTIQISGGWTTYTANLVWGTDPRDAGKWFSEDVEDFQGFGIKHVDGNGTIQIATITLAIASSPILMISQTSILAIHDDVNEPAPPAAAFVPLVIQY